jgi:DnaK suppressor protein
MPTIQDQLTITEVRELRDRLEEYRRALLDEYELDMQRERAIPTDEVGDFADRAEAASDRENLLSAAEDELGWLRLIDEALRRISDGSYGICLAGGEEIPLDRLRAVPWARHCAAHQAEWEARQAAAAGRSRRGGRGASFARA